MKKIIFTVTNDLTYDRRMLRIGESLATEGYAVWLVGRALPDSKPFAHPQIVGKRFRLWFNKGKLFYLEYNVRLFFWLIFQQFDAICGVDLDTILPCYGAAILRGRPCVYDAHELFTETPEVVRRPRIRQVWLAVERFVVPKLSLCYTVSQSVADEFERRYGVPFGVIRNLPNRQNVDFETTQRRQNVIFYQGALNEGRGLETAIEAMQYVENAELWLIGEGDLSAVLRGLVAEKKLENKVKFWGFVEPHRLAEWTIQAKIGLHISEDKGLSYRYSLGNKFLDYIQSGVPQIFTQFPEYQLLNAQFNVGIMIEKTDVNLLIEALNRLLNEPEQYAQCCRNCLEAAATLCWETEAAMLTQFYRERVFGQKTKG